MGRTTRELQSSQQRAPGSLTTGVGSVPCPVNALPQIQQACTGIIVRAPLRAPGQAQQRSGRTELSNTRLAPRSPPQAKASAIRSWPVLDELADTPAIKQGQHVVGLRVGLRRLLVVSIARPDLRIRANVLSVAASALGVYPVTACHSAPRVGLGPPVGGKREIQKLLQGPSPKARQNLILAGGPPTFG